MSKKALFATVLPFISNPAVLAVVCIGAVGMTIYGILSDSEEEQANGSEAVPDGSQPFLEPLSGEGLTVPTTVSDPLETVEATVERTVHSAVEEPSIHRFYEVSETVLQQDKKVREEDIKKEVIRQAMSELGKRSAAARAKRKNI